jgi:hypothetical protein
MLLQYSCVGVLRPCLVHPKTKNYQDSLSHRILRHMHETLNIDENKNYYTFYL